MFRRVLSFLAVSALLAGGCSKIREEYTLNPDGSGKVAVRRLAPMPMTMAGAPKNLDPEAEARKVARSMVQKSRGVDAWKDVTWKVQPDGRILVTGTAYFSDLAKLGLKDSGSLRLGKGADGSMVVELGKTKKPGAGAGAGEEPKKLSGKELELAVLREKMKWQQGRGMMVAMLSGMEMTTVLHLPGEPGKLSCFKKTPDGKALTFTMKGDDFLAVMDELTAKEDFWKKQAGGGRGALDDMEVPEVLEKLFGSSEPPRVTIAKPGAALFDYAKEVAAARAGSAAMLKKLGAGTDTGSAGPGTPPPAELAPAPAGAGLGKAWVVEVHHRMKPDVPKEKNFMHSSPGCVLSLVAEMPGGALKVEDGPLEKAVAGDGTDVLNKQSFYRKTSGARLTGRNKDLVQFSVTVAPLPEGTGAIKELAGSLTCIVGSGSKKVDIGELEMKTGATGSALGAKVKRFSKNFKSLEIELDVESPTAVKGFKFTTPDGAEVALSRSGTSTWNKKSTFRFRFKGGVVEKLKVEAELFEKTEKRKLPFKLENLKLR
jgi:hypothetical protein